MNDISDIEDVIDEVFERLPNDQVPAEPFDKEPLRWRGRIIEMAHKFLTELGYQVSLTPLDSRQEATNKLHVLMDALDNGDDPETVAKFMPATQQPSAPNGFVKHDAGKVRFSLVPAEARLEVAKAFSHGAIKYPPYNFLRGADWSRYVDALYRHMNAWEMREDNDPESGLNHLAHANACLMILLTLQLKQLGKDDRPGAQCAAAT